MFSWCSHFLPILGNLHVEMLVVVRNEFHWRSRSRHSVRVLDEEIPLGKLLLWLEETEAENSQVFSRWEWLCPAYRR